MTTVRVTIADAMIHFAQVEPISERTRASLGPHLPEPVQQLWDYGVGYIGDGLLRTIDPRTIAKVTLDLADPIHASHSYPILTTAFGDVLTQWRSRLYLINSAVGRYVGLGRTERLGAVIAAVATPDTRRFLLGDIPWAQAVAAYGVPTPAECFAYVPPLSVLPRGPGDLTGLERTGLAEHLEFLARFHGPAQGLR